MRSAAAWVVLLSACAAGSPPTVDPIAVPPLLVPGETALGESVRLKQAELGGGGYVVVLENLRRVERTCRAEIRFQDAQGKVLIPADPGPFKVDLAPVSEATLKGPCPFPQAKKVLVRLSE